MWADAHVSVQIAASFFRVTVPFEGWILKNGAILGCKILLRQMLSELLWEIIKWLEILPNIFFKYEWSYGFVFLL